MEPARPEQQQQQQQSASIEGAAATSTVLVEPPASARAATMDLLAAMSDSDDEPPPQEDCPPPAPSTLAARRPGHLTVPAPPLSAVSEHPMPQTSVPQPSANPPRSKPPNALPPAPKPSPKPPPMPPSKPSVPPVALPTPHSRSCPPAASSSHAVPPSLPPPPSYEHAESSPWLLSAAPPREASPPVCCTQDILCEPSVAQPPRQLHRRLRKTGEGREARAETGKPVAGHPPKVPSRLRESHVASRPDKSTTSRRAGGEAASKFVAREAHGSSFCVDECEEDDSCEEYEETAENEESADEARELQRLEADERRHYASFIRDTDSSSGTDDSPAVAGQRGAMHSIYLQSLAGGGPDREPFVSGTSVVMNVGFDGRAGGRGGGGGVARSRPTDPLKGAVAGAMKAIGPRKMRHVVDTPPDAGDERKQRACARSDRKRRRGKTTARSDGRDKDVEEEENGAREEEEEEEKNEDLDASLEGFVVSDNAELEEESSSANDSPVVPVCGDATGADSELSGVNSGDLGSQDAAMMAAAIEASLEEERRRQKRLERMKEVPPSSSMLPSAVESSVLVRHPEGAQKRKKLGLSIKKQKL